MGSIVTDKTHLTGCFSVYGRDCVSRNIIFTKKDEILFGKKKVIKVSAYGNIAEELDDADENVDEEKLQAAVAKIDKDEKKKKLAINKPVVKKIKVVKRFKTPPKRGQPVGYLKNIKVTQTK